MCCYCIQNVKDGIQIQVYNFNNEIVNHFSQFISVKVKKNLRKFKAQVGEKLRTLQLRQNDGFLIKKSCTLKIKISEQELCRAGALGSLVAYALFNAFGRYVPC